MHPNHKQTRMMLTIVGHSVGRRECGTSWSEVGTRLGQGKKRVVSKRFRPKIGVKPSPGEISFIVDELWARKQSKSGSICPNSWGLNHKMKEGSYSSKEDLRRNKW